MFFQIKSTKHSASCNAVGADCHYDKFVVFPSNKINKYLASQNELTLFFCHTTNSSHLCKCPG